MFFFGVIRKVIDGKVCYGLRPFMDEFELTIQNVRPRHAFMRYCQIKGVKYETHLFLRTKANRLTKTTQLFIVGEECFNAPFYKNWQWIAEEDLKAMVAKQWEDPSDGTFTPATMLTLHAFFEL